MNRTHLSDDRLIELSLVSDGSGFHEPHLAECARCESRLVTLVAMMSDVNVALDAEVDQAFPPERLARQHARILQHLDQEGRPARVIAFPASYAAPVRVHRRPSRRWAAAAGAVAAAFVVGIVAGHLTHDLPGARSIPTPRAVRSAEQNTPIRTVAASLSDDELLGQIEAAVGSSGPTALQALDAVTPRAWDDR
jgi:hypothetical protein